MAFILLSQKLENQTKKGHLVFCPVLISKLATFVLRKH